MSWWHGINDLDDFVLVSFMVVPSACVVGCALARVWQWLTWSDD